MIGLSMRAGWPRVLLGILLVVLTAGLLRGQESATQAAPTKAPRLFWKATSPTTQVYLMGSIHLATPDMYPLAPEIEQAFKGSDALAVEADITKVNQLELSMHLMMEGMYLDGDSLEKHVSPETYKALEKFAADNGVPMMLIANMKPVVAAATLESLMLVTMGMDPELGIDMHFLKAANEAKKKIIELESADLQLKLLFGFEDKLGEKFLLETLRDSNKESLTKLIRTWKDGDAKAIDALVTADTKDDPDAQKMMDILVYKRNDQMTTKIEEMLKGNEKVFVVVGSAHLTGEKGVVRQLANKGFKVEQPPVTLREAVAKP